MTYKELPKIKNIKPGIKFALESSAYIQLLLADKLHAYKYSSQVD
jgi:hypothetical protein